MRTFVKGDQTESALLPTLTAC